MFFQPSILDLYGPVKKTSPDSFKKAGPEGQWTKDSVKDTQLLEAEPGSNPDVPAPGRLPTPVSQQEGFKLLLYIRTV